jgi:hypothetical protein
MKVTIYHTETGRRLAASVPAEWMDALCSLDEGETEGRVEEEGRVDGEGPDGDDLVAVLAGRPFPGDAVAE